MMPRIGWARPAQLMYALWALLASSCLSRSGAREWAEEREDARRNSDCPRVAPALKVGRLARGDLDEVSGLVASRTQPGVLWVHNDSGDRARLFAIAHDGRTLAELALHGVKARDLEDIARGPGPSRERDYLYLADTGDNLGRRERVRIYRLEEPALARGPQLEVLTREVFAIEVRYEDGPRDSEALFVDPARSDLYLVAKRRLLSHQWSVGVYRLSADEVRAGRVTARRVATVGLGPTTASDMLADGSAIAIRNYRTALYWKRAAGESVAQALARPACELPLADRDEQGESFGFMPDGSGYLTTSEGSRSPIYLYRFRPDAGATP